MIHWTQLTLYRKIGNDMEWVVADMRDIYDYEYVINLKHFKRHNRLSTLMFNCDDFDMPESAQEVDWSNPPFVFVGDERVLKRTFYRNIEAFRLNLRKWNKSATERFVKKYDKAVLLCDGNGWCDGKVVLRKAWK